MVEFLESLVQPSPRRPVVAAARFVRRGRFLRWPSLPRLLLDARRVITVNVGGLLRPGDLCLRAVSWGAPRTSPHVGDGSSGSRFASRGRFLLAKFADTLLTVLRPQAVGRFLLGYPYLIAAVVISAPPDGSRVASASTAVPGPDRARTGTLLPPAEFKTHTVDRALRPPPTGRALPLTALSSLRPPSRCA